MQILNQISEAVLLAINGNCTQPRFVSHALRDLARLESRPPRLTEIAYEWCSAIYANREKFEDLENLLLGCLELGFRHLDSSERDLPVKLTHTEHHRGLADVVFNSQKSEVIVDLLHALTANGYLPEEADEMVGICLGHLVDCYKLVPPSRSLRQLVKRFVKVAGYERFEGVELGKLIGLLDDLSVTVEEMDDIYERSPLLMDVIRSCERPQRLSDWHWECLVELAVLGRAPEFGDAEALKIAESLIDAEEWGKLERWIGVVWMCSGLGYIPEEGLEPPTLLLLRHRPGAAQRLEQWMEQWNQRWKKVTPEPLRRILTQAYEAAQQQVSP